MQPSATIEVSTVFSVHPEWAWTALTDGDLIRASQPFGPIPGIVAIHDEPPEFFDIPGLSRTFENSDGSTATETIVSLDPARSLQYTVTNLTNPFRFLTPGADARFDFEPVDGVGTRVTWRYTWHARATAALPLLWLISHLAFRPSMRRMLARLAEQAEACT